MIRNTITPSKYHNEWSFRSSHVSTSYRGINNVTDRDIWYISVGMSNMLIKHRTSFTLYFPASIPRDWRIKCYTFGKRLWFVAQIKTVVSSRASSDIGTLWVMVLSIITTWQPSNGPTLSLPLPSTCPNERELRYKRVIKGHNWITIGLMASWYSGPLWTVCRSRKYQKFPQGKF